MTAPLPLLPSPRPPTSAGPEPSLLRAQILEAAIKYRWKTLPAEQQAGIKAFIVNLVIMKSSSEETFTAERVFMTKLNVILVQARKHLIKNAVSPAQRAGWSVT